MRWILIAAIFLIIVGITGLAATSYYTFYTADPGADRGPFRGPRGPGATVPPETFSTNGERIYVTGTSSEDTITVTGGPQWFRVHGGGCASCHGRDGRGGPVMMSAVDAPNITYESLTRGHEGERPYTDELIERAITRGLDSDGEELDPAMPRWSMSDDDLSDLIDYLKTLSE